MADKYILSVTAGPNYEDQKPVAINTDELTHISNEHLSAKLQIRIQNYRGLPTGSPKTSPYFSHAPHQHDLYSLGFSFTPKEDINGADVVLGNDFDHPIRDKLPPGFNQAFNLVKWFVDPGLYGDVYADEPYLLGPLLSSINTLRIGAKEEAAHERAEETKASQSEGAALVEGADGDGEEVRHELGIPAESAARKKFFLNAQHLEKFTFEKGREYTNDFFNPYLDFNEFSLKLPGFGMIPGITLPIISYWDGQPLRYVLKNRKTNEPLFVVVFTLVPKDGEKSETAKEDKAGQESKGNTDEDVD